MKRLRSPKNLHLSLPLKNCFILVWTDFEWAPGCHVACCLYRIQHFPVCTLACFCLRKDFLFFTKTDFYGKEMASPSATMWLLLPKQLQLCQLQQVIWNRTLYGCSPNSLLPNFNFVSAAPIYLHKIAPNCFAFHHYFGLDFQKITVHAPLVLARVFIPSVQCVF